MPNLQEVDNEVIFEVRLEVRAGRNEIVGLQRDASNLKLKIKISTSPVKPKANKALVHFLARKLGVKESLIPYVLIPTPVYEDDCPDTGHCS